MFWGFFGICTPTGLNGQNDVFFTLKCIRLVCEKLTIFPHGQDIVENIVLLAFQRYSQVQDRNRGLREVCKNVTVDTQNGHSAARCSSVASG